MPSPNHATAALHIFKPGRHVPLSGTPLEFSAADLAATAAAYDPAKHEAPIVVGHPALDAPAYGWVGGVTADAGGLFAAPTNVDAAFAELVAAGRFKKISASFYAPDAPANPVPGVYYLRHVGFLGAAAPAVKGLRNPSFAADEAGVIEFGDCDDQTNAGLWRSMRDWLLAKFGQSDADSAIPPFYVSSLEAAAVQPEPADAAGVSGNAPMTAFAASPTQETHVTPEQAAALEAENTRLAALVAEGVARDKASATAARHASHAAFAEGLAAEGRLLPTQAAIAVAVLDFAAAPEAVIEFGEGEARQPLADAFKLFLAALPKQVDFSEFARRDAAGKLVTRDGSTLAVEAQAYQAAQRAAGNDINIAQAVSHVAGPVR